MVNIIIDVNNGLKHIFTFTCAGKADCEQKDKHFVICTNPCYPEVSEDRSDNVQAVTVTVFGCRLAFVLSDGWLVGWLLPNHLAKDRFLFLRQVVSFVKFTYGVLRFMH